MAKIFVATVLLASGSSAAAIRRSVRPYGTCQEFDVAVTAEAPGARYNFEVNDDISAIHWAVESDTWSVSPLDRIVENITISGTYNIHAKLCVPNSPDKKDVLQIATHGGHYDHRYWDSDYKPGETSYVEAAMKAGYPILAYDRLGAGKSDHPEDSSTQAEFELEILRQLTIKARKGHLDTYGGWSDTDRPSKIVHVGHSFGSVVTTAFLATYPNETSGGIITGYALNQFFGKTGFTSMNLQYAATATPAWDRGTGYLVAQKNGIQTIFFGGDPATAFTPELLSYGDSIKQPVPAQEFTSGYQIVGRPGLDFKAPIQYILPEFDFFICGGDCKGVTSEEILKNTTWPAATALELVIQPNTGHAMPLHKNATAGFQTSLDFLGRNGL
ncbi:MAG: hypothetical protein Q9160_008183 [Pyrenula sp. 1 TL-2023]